MNIYKTSFPNSSMEKCLVMVSGGLDSKLACKIMQEQTEVEAIFFILPFSGGCCSDKFCVFKFCQQEKIKLHIVDCTKGKLLQEYLNMLRNPKHGRGTALNPCRDCHIFMMKKAKELADSLKIKIIATGEVLGERPFSQTRHALTLIDKKIGFEIIRPLSAKLMLETSWEKSNLLERNKFYDIVGRRRTKQLELAKKYNISAPPVGGGCVLCDPQYCDKLKPILNSNLTYQDIQLIKIGRHIEGIILSRNEKEGNLLLSQAGIKIIPQDNPGPTALIKNKNDIEKAKELIKKYSKHKI